MGDHPFPAVSGLSAYGLGAARALAAAGCEVTALGLAPGPAPPPPGDDGVRWVTVPGGPRARFRSLASGLPAMAHAYATPAYRAALREALDGGPWDAVVVDHLQMGWALAELGTGGAPPVAVFVSHNHERTVRAEVAALPGGGAARRAALRLDARKVARLERAVVERADVVTAITTADLERFRAEAPGTAMLHLPPGWDGARAGARRITEATPRQVAMVGSLQWHVKQANLRAFVAAADPLFAEAGIELKVVGDAPESFVAEITASSRATTFTRRVPEIGPELSSARLGVVAEQAGGGFKMKALDYVFNRVPVAVLDGSTEDLPLEPGRSVLSFPDMRALAAGIVAAVDDLPLLNRMQELAFEVCDRTFTWARGGAALRSCLEQLARP